MSNADQAARLRQLFKKQQDSAVPVTSGNARVIAVSSGKGGVGKTNVAANLAITFAGMGQRVALVDADYALANVDILLGFNPQYTLENVLDGRMSIGEILVEGPGGIKVVPASSGIQRLSRLDTKQLNLFYNALQILEKHFDHLILDTAAGIGDDVISLLLAAREAVVVTNPEPPAFVDSYAMIKHLVHTNTDVRIRIVVNQVSDVNEAQAVYDRIAKTVEKFLKSSIEYLGHVTEDVSVKKAVRMRRPFVLEYPNSVASRCIDNLARKLLREERQQPTAGFWNNLKSVMDQRY